MVRTNAGLANRRSAAMLRPLQRAEFATSNSAAFRAEQPQLSASCVYPTLGLHGAWVAHDTRYGGTRVTGTAEYMAYAKVS